MAESSLTGLRMPEENHDGTRLAASLGYLAWQYLAGAVMEVFRENQALEDRDRKRTPANSEDWTVCDQMRQDLWVRARACWCARTGIRSQHFPYSRDAVVKIYLRYRKRSSLEVAAFEAEIRRAGG